MTRFAWIAAIVTLGTAMANAADRPPGCPHLPGASIVQTSIADLTGALPVPDYLDAVIACVAASKPAGSPPATPPRSEWLEADAGQYSDLLGHSRFEMLILPAQTQYFGFDRTERSLISAEIADAFSGEGSIPSTFLVARALGEVRRRYEAAAIVRLAGKVGAQRLLEVYAGHDGNHRMTLTLQLKDCSAAGVCKLAKQHDWRSLPFSDEMPPFLVVRGLHEALRQEILGPAAHPEPKLAAARHDGTDFGNLSVAGLAGKSPKANAAEISTLLASLAPDEDELGRERLHALALRASLRAGAGPADRVLAAYAARNLERRPYALKLLEGLTDPGALTMQALLNGNLPEAEKTYPSVSAPLARLLLAFEIEDLRRRYSRKGAFDQQAGVKLFAAAADEWRSLIMRRASINDDWGRTNALEIKRLLDSLFPIAGLDLKTMRQGAQVVGESAGDDAQMGVANLRHLRKALAKLDPRDCCNVERQSNPAWQIYWLLEAETQSNVLKDFNRVSELQALPAVALRQAENFDGFLDGHPWFERLRLAAAYDQATRVPEEAARRLNARAEASKQIAIYWMQGQSIANRSYLSGRGEFVDLADAMSHDFPRRFFWAPMLFAKDPQRDYCDGMAYTTNDPQPAIFCFNGAQGADKARMRAALEKRFHGHPGGDSIFAERTGPGSGPADEVGQLKVAIKTNPAAWENYEALGLMLITGFGKYEEAQQLFLSHPQFKTPDPDNAVAESNHAYTAGTALYWHGQPGLARPLYQIAADLDTGSSASISAAGRLALLDQDYPAAAEASLERGRRYSSAFAYGDYLSLLHVMGHGAEAHSGFVRLADAFEEPSVWMSALVEQRMQGMSYEQFRKWVLSDEIRDSHHRGFRFAPIYALWWNVVGRTPGPDLPKLMEQIEANATRKIDADGSSVMRPTAGDERRFLQIQPSLFRRDKSPRLPPGTPVKSEYVLLSDALASFHAADYRAAVDKFVALGNRYEYENGDLKFVLGYFAFAAGKTGDKLGFEKYLQDSWDSNSDFDIWISRAMFAAARHDSAAADHALERALEVRVPRYSRAIPTEYQYAEACEIARRETGDSLFDARIIRWAKQYQTIRPTEAWPYALEATYSKVESDVTRALAMTIYLDPASPRLKDFGAPRLAAARAWLKTNNPFLPTRVQPADRVTQWRAPGT